MVACAGAIDSPRLLQLSGIGPAAVLRAAGVDVRVDLPGVGENLMDHAEGIVDMPPYYMAIAPNVSKPRSRTRGRPDPPGSTRGAPG